MNKLTEILNHIERHCSKEIKEQVFNPTIGRGELTIKGMNNIASVWVVNYELQPNFGLTYDVHGNVAGTFSKNGPADIIRDSGSITISKNKQYARILLQNFSGEHSCLFANGRKQTFRILNSAHYTNTGTDICNVYIGAEGEKGWTYLSSLFTSIDAKTKELERKREEERRAKDKAEELRRKLAEEAERLAREEALRLEEEARKAEEEARRLKAETDAVSKEREALEEASRKAQEFIHSQVSLRRNPVLDKKQDAAKFSNIFNGVAQIINGGPGTGKTTTMIQRLKFLIDRGDLEDFRENNPEVCKLTNKQIEIITGSSNNWIYFSPNDLLKKYLQDNMGYEGLLNANEHTKVWKTFLKYAVRDNYHLAGQDCPFDFAKESKAEQTIFRDNSLEVVKGFTKFFVRKIKEKLLKVSKIDVSSFEWKFLGKLIVNECAKVEEMAGGIRPLLMFFINLERIDQDIIVRGERMKSGAEISRAYNEDMRKLTNKYIALLQRDEEEYNKTLELVKSLKKATQTDAEESEDNDEMEEEEPDYGELSLALANRINSLLKRLCLQKKDATAKLSPVHKQLYDLVGRFLDEEELDTYADSAYFVKYFTPALKGFRQYMLTSIPTYYKQYRKTLTDDDKRYWNETLLDEILKKKNRLLLGQEQALLVGFINNLAVSIYKESKEKFEKINHKYLDAYKSLCRPVIGVDEATDYSMIDYYGIKSFGHYEICSYTLSGDVMQMMKENGIDDWNKLKLSVLFKNIDIHNLTVSYRQTEELLSLANKIYQNETGKEPPYSCHSKEKGTPKPLWHIDDDMTGKAQWISDRVMEITRTYGYVPSIAIFTVDKVRAEELREELSESQQLINAGIDVKVCSGNTLEEGKTLRIFPIDQVKGMEFEAVFFYDIDELASTSLVNKYLYVGVSRASMYLAVTSNENSHISEMLMNYFDDNSTWG